MDLHGYSLADIDRLARSAGRWLPSATCHDPGEALAVARHAITEQLLVRRWLPANQLVMVARRAVQDHARTEDRHHGLHRHAERSADGRRPSFAVYWLGDAHTAASPEGGVVDRAALGAILERLPAAQLAAVLALATTDDYQAAADLLGVGYDAFARRIWRARRGFLALWHEGETPSGLWRRDRRVGTLAPAGV